MKSISKRPDNRRYCDGCILDHKRQPFSMETREGARFLVVTPTPSLRDSVKGDIMSPPSQRILAQSMRKERFVQEDFAIVPQVRCAYDPDLLTTKEKRGIQQQCRQYLLDDIEEMKPEVIIPMGAEASVQVLNKPLKITKVRGVAERSEEHQTMVLPMLSPLQVALYPQHQSTFSSDCATLGRLVDHDYDITASSVSSSGAYELVDDLQFLIDEKPMLISFDTENTSLRWYDPTAKILTMQFCTEEGKAYMLPWEHPDMPRTNRQKSKLIKQLIQLLCRPDVVIIGQNLKYDALFLWAQTGIKIKIGGDTLMLAALLDENALTKNLDDLTRRYVPAMAGYADRFNATVDKSRMADYPLDQNFLDYGCGDADAVFRLYRVLMRELCKDDRLYQNYLHVSLPGLNAFRSIETRGMFVNEDEVSVFEAFMREKTEAAYASLLSQVARSIKRKHVDKGLKFSRPEFTRDVLFDHPDGFRLKPKAWTKGTAKLADPKRRIPSTSTKDHLPFFYDDCPFTFELATYIKDERLLGTNIIGFKNKYIHDGKVRPVFRLDVAVTGRSSSEDPNGQNMPKRGDAATAYRKLFIAPEGYYFLEADLSQAELRIAANMANDRTMLEVYRTGGDIHITTALFVMGITRAQFDALSKAEQKLARFKAKAVNFGFLYGMGWRKFIVYAKTQYGVVFTDNEAQRIREAFFETYWGLPEWHRQMRELAREHKQVRSYSGRVRHLPMIDSTEDYIRSEAERQAINSPVQEFGSTLGVMALSRIEQAVDPEYLEVVSFVHDAIYTHVPVQYLEWGAKTLKRYMESNPIYEAFGHKLKVPIEADVSFGVNLGEMNELKGLKLDAPTVRARAANVYDFGQFWNEDEQTGLVVPRQMLPPNNGLRTEPMFTEYREAA